MDSITIALVDFDWFAEDFSVQEEVEAWLEYSQEGDEASSEIEAWLEYSQEANYDDHIIDVMNGMVEEYYEGRG